MKLIYGNIINKSKIQSSKPMPSAARQ